MLQAQAMVDAALPVPPAGAMPGGVPSSLSHTLPAPCSRVGCVRETPGAQHKAAGLHSALLFWQVFCVSNRHVSLQLELDELQRMVRRPLPPVPLSL